jgi:hypothetical protein
MRANRLAICLVALVASMTWACANGGDVPADDGEPGLGEAGTDPGHDSGSGSSSGSSSGGGSGSSSGGRDSGSPGDEASVAKDASSVDASEPQESSTTQQEASSPADTGAGQDTGVVNGVCPNGGKWEAEAIIAAASLTPTICLIPNCPSGQCCYEQASPFNVCVAQ